MFQPTTTSILILSVISVSIIFTNPYLKYLRPEKYFFKRCLRRNVDFLEKSNDLEFSIRGLHTRVFCLKNEPWRVIIPIEKTLHVVDAETGVTEMKNVTGYCLKLHARYRMDGREGGDHYDYGRPRHLQGGGFFGMLD